MQSRRFLLSCRLLVFESAAAEEFTHNAVVRDELVIDW